MVKLVVKAPNQKIADQTIHAEVDWTVKKLKEFLSEEYPSKPAPSDQRLIYSGHLLRDEQSLQEVFSPVNDDFYILHLVVSQKVSASPSSSTTSGNPSRRGSLITDPQSQQQTSSNPQAVPPTPPFNAMMNGFNSNLFNPMMMNGTAVMPGVVGAPVMPMMMMWTPEQLAAVQQMYTQFVTQYQAVQGNLHQLPLNNHVVPDQVVRQRNNVVNNEAAAAAPIVEDDDEVENRDWLDWFYWMSRSIVLIAIVYFYSSFTRLALVFTLAIIMYLYQNGFLNARNEQERAVEEDDIVLQEPPRQEGAPQQQPLENNQRFDQENNRDNQVRDPSSLNNQTTTPVTDRFSGLRICWVILSGLFTSLIPDQAPAQFN
jgi:hypothetical protein